MRLGVSRRSSGKTGLNVPQLQFQFIKLRKTVKSETARDLVVSATEQLPRTSASEGDILCSRSTRVSSSF